MCLGINANLNLARSRSASNVKSILSISQETFKRMNMNSDEQKLGFTTALLLRLRQKSINQMISGINNEYEDKYKNTLIIDNMDDIERNKFAHSKCLFRNGDGFRIKWDLIIMLLAIYNCFMIPIQF